MVSLPESKKNFEDMFFRFDVIHERDGQTDGRTLHHSKDRAYASYRAVKIIHLASELPVHRLGT